MSRPIVTQIEAHVTHACNFTCTSCTHFSNENYSGRETPESWRDAVAPWAARIEPKNFLVLGGEPTLNPDLCEILEITRGLWPAPETRVILVTNGWFLHRHPRLAEVLPANNITLDISIHHDAPEYTEKLDEIKRLVDSWGLTLFRWRDSFKDWTRVYNGVGQTAAPFEDGDPQSSWRECVSKWCFTIRDGTLCKCPMAAWLPMHVKKYGDAGGKWAPYLKYLPLKPTCSDAELEEFIHRKCESVCGMCPARPEQLLKSLPMRGVA